MFNQFTMMMSSGSNMMSMKKNNRLTLELYSLLESKAFQIEISVRILIQYIIIILLALPSSIHHLEVPVDMMIYLQQLAQ